MRRYLIIGLFLCCQAVNAQTIGKINGDLKGAVTIRVNQKYTFPKSPAGYGTLKEFRLNPRRSSNLFREERNSAWFIIDIPISGSLTFDIIPHNPDDDYDWMLYKHSPDLENLIGAEKATPLRSNNARNNTGLKSKTGISSNKKNIFAKPGPGSNYSAVLMAKKGSRLVLVVDNIYGGKGFDLSLNIKPQIDDTYVVLEGIVKGKISGRLLPAEVVIEDDSTGMVIGKTTADALTGKYKIMVPANRPLNSTAYHPDYLFATDNIFVKQNSQQNYELDSIAKGSKLVLFNIHFYPNKDLVIPSARPELDRLLRFMKEHPQWSVKITGHTNNNLFASSRYLQQLSFNRALAVKNYLLQHAISAKRISCAGLGGKEPLVNTRDPELGLKNLRVEVLLEKSGM